MNHYSLVSGIVIFLAALAPATGQVPSTIQVDQIYKDLRPQAREVVESYLRTDCEIGEVGTALNRILKIAQEVRPYLLAVERYGPRSEELADFQRGLDESWRARQEFLKTPDARELGEQSFQMMTAITEAQYRKDQLQAIQAKYREKAALALKAMSRG